MTSSPDLRNYGQLSVSRGTAFAGVPYAPSVANGIHGAREVKRAMRDPRFAEAFRHRLSIENLIYIVLAECLLIAFLGIGYLVLH